jgi:hypothetical protein
VVALSFVALVACQRQAPETPPASREARPRSSNEVADPTCVVASGRGFAITMAEVEALRQRYAPSPEVGAATRLAVDVWLAEWIATDEIDRLPLREKIRHQQRLAMEHRRAWGERLRDAAAELELHHGPCYVPR